MIKKIILLSLPLIIIGTHLSRRISLWFQVNQEIKSLQEEKQRLEKNNQQLRQKKRYYQSPEFIEREAREKLGLTKKNDLVLIIPTPPDLSALQPKGESYNYSPPWQQWWQLFFSSNNPLDF